MSHTPGPWVFKQWERITIESDVDFKHPIAHVYRRPEQAANSFLIAAAPDLLEACEAVLADMNTGLGVDGHTVNAVTAAVAKAKKDKV